MWWVAVDGKHLPGVTLPDGSYAARGSGGHMILVVPPLDMVVVHRVNTYFPNRSVSGTELGKLVGLILAAHESAAEKLNRFVASRAQRPYNERLLGEPTCAAALVPSLYRSFQEAIHAQSTLLHWRPCF